MFLTLLTILFIGLKLAGIIMWSWFWVLSPLIFQAILTIIVVLLAGIYMIINKDY